MNAFRLLSTQPWVEWLGWTLVHFLWQGTLIAALYAIVRRSPNVQLRYLLACAALTAMVAAPIVTFTLTATSTSAPNNPFTATVPVSSSAASVVSLLNASPLVLASRTPRNDVMPWLVMAWFAGAIAFWIRSQAAGSSPRA